MAGNGITFDDISTGISYEQFPKDPAAREAIAIVNNKVEKLKDSTVSRQDVINLENKVKQSGLDSENFKEQVNMDVKNIKDMVDGLDGGNLEKIEELAVAIGGKANKDVVDSLLFQIEGSVKQINGVTPDANGNVEINVDTEGLATKDELEGLVDGLESQITAKADQTEINAAKGSFGTLKEKLDSIGTGGGGGGGLAIEPYNGELIIKTNIAKPRNLHAIDARETSISLYWEVSPEAEKYEIFVNGTKKGETTDYKYAVTGLVKNTTYAIELQAVSGAKKSIKVPLTAKTLGDRMLTVVGNYTDKVVFPKINCVAIELYALQTPKANVGDSNLISTAEGKKVQPLFDGVNWYKEGFKYHYVDGVLDTDPWYWVIPPNKLQTLLMADENPFDATVTLFNGTMAAKLYKVRFLERNGLNDLVPIADYDFTRIPTTANKVVDNMGNFAAATITGATFTIN